MIDGHGTRNYTREVPKRQKKVPSESQTPKPRSLRQPARRHSSFFKAPKFSLGHVCGTKRTAHEPRMGYREVWPPIRTAAHLISIHKSSQVTRLQKFIPDSRMNPCYGKAGTSARFARLIFAESSNRVLKSTYNWSTRVHCTKTMIEVDANSS